MFPGVRLAMLPLTLQQMRAASAIPLFQQVGVQGDGCLHIRHTSKPTLRRIHGQDVSRELPFVRHAVATATISKGARLQS